jgi:hypothetical protein
MYCKVFVELVSVTFLFQEKLVVYFETSGRTTHDILSPYDMFFHAVQDGLEAFDRTVYFVLLE